MRSVVAATGTLPRVAHLTANFTSETPLSPRVAQALAAAFEDGWADPKKLGQAASRAASLGQAAREEIAAHWKLSPAHLEVTGEPDLLHFLALTGYLTSDSMLVTSSIDLGKIRAIARAQGDRSLILESNRAGQVLPTPLPKNSLICLQHTNGETGVVQDLRQWQEVTASIVLDATHAIPEDEKYANFAAVTMAASSWNGPAGIGLIAINDAPRFRYPLPHIAPIRVPGSYSLPLLVGSAIALNEMMEERSHCYDLRNQLRNHLSAIEKVTVIGGDNDSRYLSVVIDGVSGEEILRALLKRDLLIDSGSACSPQDLTPSHVIAAMGYPTEGHLRFTIHPHHTSGDIEFLLTVFKEELHLLNR